MSVIWVHFDKFHESIFQCRVKTERELKLNVTAVNWKYWSQNHDCRLSTQWTSAWFIARICGGGNEPARFLIQTDNQEFDSIKITENAWRNLGFLKTVRTGLLCTPDLVYSFFELISYSFQGERGKCMNLGRISWLWIPVQISRHLALITHDATMSVHSSVPVIIVETLARFSFPFLSMLIWQTFIPK